MLDAAAQAVADGSLRAPIGRRVKRLGSKVRRPTRPPTTVTIGRYHKKASRALGRACALLSEAH